MNRNGSSDASGFTLVEILVVLTIIGITIAMVRFNAMPNDRDEFRNETTRFAMLIEQAANEARTRGRGYACVVNAKGYYFEAKRDDGRWIMTDDDILRPRFWREGMTVTGIDIDGMPMTPNQRILLSSSGYNSVFSIRLAYGNLRAEVAGTLTGRVNVIH